MKQQGIRFALCLASIAVMVRDVSAQKPFIIDFGVRGGVLLGQPLDSNPNSGQRSFLPTLTIDNVYGTIGPTFGLQLYNRVDVRLEWVYKRFSYQLQSTVPPIAGYTSFSRIKAHSWEYPLLATYKFGSGNVRPFAGGGMNLGGTATSTSTDQNTITSTNPPVTTTTQRMTSMGLPTAYHIIGGLDWRFPIFSVRPELRYTRWTADTITGSFVANKPNQFEAVVGFTLHPFPAR